MTTILVTGGSGFIGYNLSKYLLEKELDVIVYDNFSDYYSKALKLKNAHDLERYGATIVEGDILEKEFLSKTIARYKVEKLIHLAAQPGVRYSTMNPERSLQVNVQGTSTVLCAARESGVSRVVITSSSSVFGRTVFLPMDEGHPKNPLSFYGVSKLSTEHLVSVCNHLYPEFETVVIRPFTVVGERQRPDMALNIFVSKAMLDQPITIFGDGSQTRDFTHVENMAQAFYLAAFRPKAKHQTFNIGAGTRISVNQILRMISEVTNREIMVKYTSMDKADAKDTFADIGKAKHLLGYDPRKTLYDAIEDFTEFWLKIQYEKETEYQTIKSEITETVTAR